MFNKWEAVNHGKVHSKALLHIMAQLDSEFTDEKLNNLLQASNSYKDGFVLIDVFLDWLLRKNNKVSSEAGSTGTCTSTLTTSASSTSTATTSVAPATTVTSADACTKSPSEAILIDGKKIADSILAIVKTEVASMQNSCIPCLVVVMVGDNPASATYVRRKEDAAKGCGIISRIVSLSSDISQAQLLEEIESLNSDDGVHGIIVQLPLPPGIDAAKVTGAVAAHKDVDGFTPANIGSVALNGYEPLFSPCTPKGCLHLLKSTGVPLRGKEAVIVGASNIVGIPMMLLLLKEGCTVSICHIDTADSAWHARNADILVVAVGKAGLVRGDWIKPGAIVIDVGINFVADSSKKTGKRMVGDVEFDEARPVAGYITPVPGGVGPMTVAMLMQNTLDAAKHSLIKQ